MTPLRRLPSLPWLAGVMIFSWQSAQAGAAETAAAAQFHQKVQPVLEEYCYECHGDGMNKGDVAFDELQSDDEILNRDLWSKVLKNLRAGIMPPQKAPRPGPAERKVLEDWVKYEAFGIDPKNPDPGRVTLRRLNRAEYRNTVRDLMGVDFNTDVEFPPDDTGYGFDDIGDVLTVSPLLLEKYMTAATAIVEEAVPKVARVIPLVTLAGSRFRPGAAEAGRRQPRREPAGHAAGLVVLRAGHASPHPSTPEQAGSYRLALELSVRGAFDFDPGKCRVIFKVDGRELLRKEFAWEDNKTFPPFIFEEKWQAGAHRMSFELEPLTPAEQKLNSLEMRINSVSIQGPMEEKYWSRPKNYERFFTRDAPEGRRRAAAICAGSAGQFRAEGLPASGGWQDAGSFGGAGRRVFMNSRGRPSRRGWGRPWWRCWRRRGFCSGARKRNRLHPRKLTRWWMNTRWPRGSPTFCGPPCRTTNCLAWPRGGNCAKTWRRR